MPPPPPPPSCVQCVQPRGGLLPGDVPDSGFASHVHGRRGRFLGTLCPHVRHKVRPPWWVPTAPVDSIVATNFLRTQLLKKQNLFWSNNFNKLATVSERQAPPIQSWPGMNIAKAIVFVLYILNYLLNIIRFISSIATLFKYFLNWPVIS